MCVNTIIHCAVIKWIIDIYVIKELVLQKYRKIY